MTKGTIASSDALALTADNWLSRRPLPSVDAAQCTHELTLFACLRRRQYVLTRASHTHTHSKSANDISMRKANCLLISLIERASPRGCPNATNKVGVQ